ncbi:class I SAM-dependent methyltransferase [Pseudokineococcus sp. 5B2Z-1]|uniref:class I SAM-dependent methyltransferase n=1 Tax=Pseudokineococcus sp. 5B2Z-1 TaxID=3132744 RepID=UPI0030AF6850
MSAGEQDQHGHGHGQGQEGHGHGPGGQQRAAGTTDAGRAVLEDDALGVEERWEGFYVARGRIWSGRPNALLVEVAEPLVPGRALDLGCGEGGDSVWLASRGWAVTSVDVAPTALARTREAAAAAGVEVTTEQHDLERSLPAGPFDLVSAFFLQSPVEWDRAAVLRRASGLLAPEGHLVLVDHGSAPSWSWHGGHDFPTAQELHDGLALPPEDFEAVRVDAPVRVATGPEGQVGEVTDTVVVVRRRG